MILKRLDIVDRANVEHDRAAPSKSFIRAAGVTKDLKQEPRRIERKQSKLSGR